MPSYLVGSGDAVWVAVASVRNSSTLPAPRYRDLGAPVGTIQMRGPHRLAAVCGTLVDDPLHTRDVLGTRRVHVGVDRTHQLVLVGIALRQAHVHARGRDVADRGHLGADLLTRRRVRARPVDSVAAPGVGLPAVGQRRQPDREPRASRRRPSAPPRRRSSGSGPAVARWAETSTCRPIRPARCRPAPAAPSTRTCRGRPAATGISGVWGPAAVACSPVQYPSRRHATRFWDNHPHERSRRTQTTRGP